MTISLNFENIVVPKNGDEQLYSNLTSNFTVEHIKYLYSITMETKPLPFLSVQKILGNANYIYTRILNFLLIFLCTILIYKITNNKLSFLYVLIPIFLDTMWLTAEIIEIFFILLSIQYVNKSGMFVGLATIFRPSSLLYSILLKKKHILVVMIIGTLYAVLLVYLGLFFPYLYEVTSYTQTIYGTRADFIVILYLYMLIIMGITNKRIFPYVVVSAIPLLMKVYWHYFLPVYTFLYIGYLLNLNEDLKDIKF